MTVYRPSALAAIVNDGSSDGHRLHLLLLLGSYLVITLGWRIFTTAKFKPALAGSVMARWPGLRQPRIRLIALASTASASVHLAVSPEHFRESTSYGAFFIVLACGQFMWTAQLLRRPTSRCLKVGATAMLAVVGLWLETRTLGLGAGALHPGTEPFGLPDLIASAAEILIVYLALTAGVSSARAQTTAAAALKVPLTLTGTHRPREQSTQSNEAMGRTDS